MKWLIILFAVLTNASASLLIKIGLQIPNFEYILNKPWIILKNLPLLFGLFLYGLTFIFYVLSLKFFPLNIAHPTITAGAIGMVTLLSAFVLEETLRPLILLGIFFIVLGVVLITSFVN
tara:strand:- start:1168 stop:1524 length:357 start_codon:yes stop_codon:yes gene_type:complete